MELPPLFRRKKRRKKTSSYTITDRPGITSRNGQKSILPRHSDIRAALRISSRPKQFLYPSRKGKAAMETSPFHCCLKAPVLKRCTSYISEQALHQAALTALRESPYSSLGARWNIRQKPTLCCNSVAKSLQMVSYSSHSSRKCEK